MKGINLWVVENAIKGVLATYPAFVQVGRKVSVDRMESEDRGDTKEVRVYLDGTQSFDFERLSLREQLTASLGKDLAREGLEMVGQIATIDNRVRFVVRDVGVAKVFQELRGASVKTAYTAHLSNAEDGQRTGDGTSVGIFIPLPPALAAQFPKTRGKDKSPPHVTFLYIGKVPVDKEEIVADIIERTLHSVGQVSGTLNGLDYFTNQHGQRIPHVSISFDIDMSAVRRQLRRELMDAGVDVADSFHYQYVPHSTLGYFEEGQDFTGRVPEGSWDFDTIELWGCSKSYVIPLTKALAKAATSTVLRRLATWVLKADLSPPLGMPTESGPCLVVDRIEKEIRNPKVRDQLVEDLEVGDFGSKGEIAVYDPHQERGPGKTTMLLVEHVQRRMDERGITVPELRVCLQNFLADFHREKSRQSYLYKALEEKFTRTEKITWRDKNLGIEVVFRFNRTQFVLVTAYRYDEQAPKFPSGGCKKSSDQRETVAVAILKGDSLLLLRRSMTETKVPGSWEMPGGGIDPGETPEQAALRECQEEAGIVPNLVGELAVISTDSRILHVFVAFGYTGTVTLNPAEHEEYSWVDRRSYAVLETTPLHRTFVPLALNYVHRSPNA